MQLKLVEIEDEETSKVHTYWLSDGAPELPAVIAKVRALRDAGRETEVDDDQSDNGPLAIPAHKAVELFVANGGADLVGMLVSKERALEWLNDDIFDDSEDVKAALRGLCAEN
jgi:hypothetical protein